MTEWLQKPGNRSRAGQFMTAVIVVAALGIMACIPGFPVPIGNPERARIDDRLTGVWLAHEEEEEYAALWVFRPWDKHTWLLQTADLDLPPEEAPADQETPAGETTPPDVGETHPDGEPVPAKPRWMRAQSRNFYSWKVWETTLGGEMFLTLEPMQTMDSELGFKTPIWPVMHVRADDDFSEIKFAFVKTGFEAFEMEKIQEALKQGEMSERQARRKIERVISRNVGNPDLYDEESPAFRRLPIAQYEAAAEVMGMSSEPFK